MIDVWRLDDVDLVASAGESASVMTCIEGFEMAKRGRAGAALGIAAFGSFIAGTLGLIGLILLAPPLAEFALDFGPPEYFALTLVGLTLVSFLGGTSWQKALAMAALGLLLGHRRARSGAQPGSLYFRCALIADRHRADPDGDGPLGLAQVFTMLERRLSVDEIVKAPSGLRNLLPNREEWRDAIGAILRGTVVGFLVGILPGAGATISSYVAYAVEKRRSPHPQRFGHGAIEASRRRKRRTTRRPRAASFRCSRWDCPQTS